MICVGGYGRKEFAVLMSKSIPNLNFYADPQQSFPFYTYDEDGTNRRENITDWALTQFRAHYRDEAITKWGHLSLYLRPPASPCLSGAVWCEPQAGPAAPSVHTRLLGVCQSGSTVGRNSRRLRGCKRIFAPGRRNTQYTAQLGCRKDETVQRQNADQVQRFPDP